MVHIPNITVYPQQGLGQYLQPKFSTISVARHIPPSRRDHK